MYHPDKNELMFLHDILITILNKIILDEIQQAGTHTLEKNRSITSDSISEILVSSEVSKEAYDIYLSDRISYLLEQIRIAKRLENDKSLRASSIINTFNASPDPNIGNTIGFDYDRGYIA
ncbi:hypothetical protein N8X83_00940, partial [Alphaproteobacteria bacterium]|nr:hypothetical protein [Alphaproteobacteria bacterium]